MRHFTSNSTDQCRNCSSKFLDSISRATSIVSDCCRVPTASVLSNKWTNHATISFHQQDQVSQGHTSYRKYTPTLIAVSHIQRLGCQPEKTTLHGGQSRSWSAEQGKVKSLPSVKAKEIRYGIVRWKGQNGSTTTFLQYISTVPREAERVTETDHNQPV